MKKRLYKSTADKRLSGVCAGLADYLNLDVSLVRIIFCVLTLFTTCFPGLIVYIICALVLPTDEEVFAEQASNPYNGQYGANQNYNPNYNQGYTAPGQNNQNQNGDQNQ